MALGQRIAVDQCQAGALGAGFWKAAAQGDVQPPRPGLGAQRRAGPVLSPIAAGAVGQAQRAGVDLHAGQGRQCTGHHHAGLGRVLAADLQAHQVVRQRQCVGHGVVGQLGPTVKRRRSLIRQGGAEQLAVEHDVTGDLTHAQPAQLGQQRAQLRQAQVGVGAAAQHQVTGQHIALQRGAAEQIGKTPVVGAQPVKCHHAGQQLQGGRRRHRPVSVNLPARGAALPALRGRCGGGGGGGCGGCGGGGRHHHRGQRIGRHLGLLQGPRHASRQGAVGRRLGPSPGRLGGRRARRQRPGRQHADHHRGQRPT